MTIYWNVCGSISGCLTSPQRRDSCIEFNNANRLFKRHQSAVECTRRSSLISKHPGEANYFSKRHNSFPRQRSATEIFQGRRPVFQRQTNSLELPNRRPLPLDCRYLKRQKSSIESDEELAVVSLEYHIE